MIDDGKKPDRRQWMSGLLRMTTASAIAIVTGWLATRTLRGECPRRAPTCGSCSLLAACRLPAARRENQMSEDAARGGLRSDMNDHDRHNVIRDRRHRGSAGSDSRLRRAEGERP